MGASSVMALRPTGSGWRMLRAVSLADASSTSTTRPIVSMTWLTASSTGLPDAALSPARTALSSLLRLTDISPSEREPLPQCVFPALQVQGHTHRLGPLSGLLRVITISDHLVD